MPTVGSDGTALPGSPSDMKGLSCVHQVFMILTVQEPGKAVQKSSALPAPNAPPANKVTIFPTVSMRLMGLRLKCQRSLDGPPAGAGCSAAELDSPHGEGATSNPDPCCWLLGTILLVNAGGAAPQQIPIATDGANSTSLMRDTFRIAGSRCAGRHGGQSNPNTVTQTATLSRARSR
jgi:hypothetical protein